MVAVSTFKEIIKEITGEIITIEINKNSRKKRYQKM